jgi:hypothetical protein
VADEESFHPSNVVDARGTAHWTKVQYARPEALDYISLMTDTTAERAPAQTDTIKRTTAPATTDGSRWEVQLSGVPTREWLQFFKMIPGASGTALSPQRLVFDRASAVFKSDEDHVEQWIEAIDRWFASAQARYALSLDEASRERTVRLDAEAKQRDRIQQLNDRFKNL